MPDSTGDPAATELADVMTTRAAYHTDLHRGQSGLRSGSLPPQVLNHLVDFLAELEHAA
ncbi:hypothetical protein AB4305_26270 [Nocardia sp. 2YAB30]|uniref:hypothetical protein n=1 Tax=unclassified Nocardia TaxID=2637762 RepID=UPI003F955BA9